MRRMKYDGMENRETAQGDKDILLQEAQVEASRSPNSSSNWLLLKPKCPRTRVSGNSTERQRRAEHTQPILRSCRGSHSESVEPAACAASPFVTDQGEILPPVFHLDSKVLLFSAMGPGNIFRM